MRTLSFENLRRLVGRRKDRDEPSFERSESFKRISIRKSYLDRGKRRTRLQKTGDTGEITAAAPVVTVEVNTRAKNVIGPTIIQVRGNGKLSDEFEFDDKRFSREEDDDDDEKKVKRDTPAGTIVYGQWLNDIDSSYSSKDKKFRIDSYSSRDSKCNIDSSREKINSSQENRPFGKRNLPKKNDEDDNRKISSVLIELDKSPQLLRSQSKSIQERNEKGNIEVDRNDRNISKNCGNVTTVNVSHSYKESTSIPVTSSYSLPLNPGVESSLEDRCNERGVIVRTVSAPDRTTIHKTDTTSTKTSGFSLSLSFSRLTTDIRAAALTTKNGLFRRHKRTSPVKPAPSVSTEGYFERTAGAASSTRRSRRASARRRPVYTSRRRKITTSKPSPRPESPVWFVPPERRRSGRQHGRVWREVRYLPEEDGKSDGGEKNDWSNDSNLSDEFDDKKLLLSGDFEEKSEVNTKKADSGSTLESSSLSVASSISLKPKISDFNEEKIFYEEYRGEKSKIANNAECNYFASSQFVGFVAKSAKRCGCTSTSESELEEQRRVLVVVGGNQKDAKDAVNLNVAGASKASDRRNCSVVLVLEGQRSRQQEGPAPKRRPLRRKSQLKRGGVTNNTRGQPVYLARRRSSLRRRPCRDITQKGYEKKRTRLLQQYASKQLAYCNCGSKLTCSLGRADKQSTMLAEFRIEVGSGEKCGPSYLRGKERIKVIEELNACGSVEVYRAQVARSTMKCGDPEPPQLRNSNVLHAAKSMHLKSSYLHADPIEAIDIMKCTIHANKIHDIGKNPFSVDFWTNDQIHAYKSVCKLYGGSLYMDSTGLKLQSIKRPHDVDSRSTFLYLLGTHCDSGQFTVGQRLGQRHTTKDLMLFLFDFHSTGAPFPKEFVCDGARAILNAAVLTYSRCMNIEEYAEQLRNKKLETRIRIDVAHFKNKYKNLLKGINRRVFCFYMAAIGHLIMTTNLIDAEKIIKSIFLLSSCETEGRKEDGEMTECNRLKEWILGQVTGGENNGSDCGGHERTSFGSGSGGGVGGRPQPRARRTQRRATHSEKRYHLGGRSGIANPPGSTGNNTGNSNSSATRRGNRRLTRNESRYHSEVRQEAVQQALAAMQSRPKPSLPMPSKRTSVMARSPERPSSGVTGNAGGESSSDEDSVVTEESPGAGGPSGTGLSDTSSTGSARDTPPPPRPPARRPPADITDIAEYTPHAYCNLVQPPDVTHTTTQSRRPAGADRVNRYHVVEENNTGTTGRWKVSAKIQQLLNTLKRPKRRPLPEFYEDDDIELEIAANPKDPNAPKPEGGTMTPAVGEQLSVPSGLPRSVEASIQRYGSASYKAPAATVLDPNGKLCVTLTYGKLLSRSYKIAYTLLNKALSRIVGECCLKPGDRIALVYPNDDPINFICAFYGCLQAGIVPVPIEVPLTRRDAGSQQIGFLLGSCGIQVALTSEACLKGLPKTTAGEVVAFKGWPKLHWFVTEHLGKTPKEWMPPTRLTDDTPAYIEYSTDRDGSVMGVTVTRAAMLAHCRALTQACGYTEGENAVCVLDFKREVGLWHSTLTSILNGMHVIFIPYALMKVNPASWMQMITKHRASVAVVKSRDLHWGLLATKDHKDISLSTLRLLLVADGANPWSLSSCDQFLSVFQSKGLRPDAVCPCASSSEALTVSVRRPGRAGVNATGRGVLSMSGLSYGVVRVDQESSLTSLTLQDCGQVMPGSIVTVIKMEGPPLVCKTDEVGEICVHSAATGSQYWGLQGLTNNNFKVMPLQSEGQPLGDVEYARSGLLGFLGPGNLVFVCGSRDGLMTVTGRKHNADDIIATVLAVEPMKFIYRGRIAVFSVRVLRDERICVVAEQRPDCSEEESFQWMSRVLQAVDSIHAVGIYCLALVPPNYLPKTPLGGIHLSETKRRFLEGTLHPANVLLCPHTCVTNLPKPREIHSAGDSVADVGPASVMVGNIVQGNRLASAQGRDMGILDEDSDNAKKYQFISEILRWRAVGTSDHVIFTSLNSKGAVAASLSCSQLHKKAERIGNLLLDRGRINTGDHVALLFPPGTDLICAFYGCLYVGAVPVTIRPPHPQNLQTTLPTVRMIVDVSKSVLILTNQNILKLLKSKEANNVVEVKSWPAILDMDDMPKKKLPVLYRAPTAEMLAYLDFSVSTTGMLAGIKMSHAAVTSLCRAMKLACELYPSRHIALCLDPYSGLGFALWCLSSIYSGHHSILIPPSEVEANPALWLSAVSHSRVRDTFCSYGVMELCTKGLGSSVHALKARGVSLACVRTCVVVAEERPRIALTSSFSKLFSALGLSPRAVSTSFGCRVNTAICLQGASSPEPSTVYVDLRALRNDRVSLVERGSPHSLCLMESGKLLPGVKVIIANPETKGQCGDSHLGEIWVQSSHNASGYFTIYGDESDYADHFNARLVTGNTNEVYARTGYLGFLRRTETVQQTVGGTDIPGDTSSVSEVEVAPGDSELHDAVFVVGALDEAILLRGMRYHPIDIENSVMRCHKKIAECAVFTWTNLLVVVVELDGSESEALDLVALVTSAVLEEHHLVVGVVVVVDPGVVPINSRGEKQRMHLRDGFLIDQLDPIYVAYNM